MFERKGGVRLPLTRPTGELTALLGTGGGEFSGANCGKGERR